ncbi:MAG TPA: hypothetical protein VN631_10255, partial [Negativicutes bacterium]|nr:hypothetical protein [Negativicutes bacterium]
DEYRTELAAVKRHGGHYSRYSKGGAIPGFHFKTDGTRKAFLDDVKRQTAEEAADGGTKYRIVETGQTASLTGIPAAKLKDPSIMEWAKKYWHDVGVKSPFFMRWFGNWRVNDQTLVTSVSVNSTKIRQAVIKARKQYGEYINRDTGFNLRVNATSISESIAKANNYNNATTLLALQNTGKILENAILVDTEINIKPTQNARKARIPFYHVFYSAIEINGKPYLAKSKVSESFDPQRTNYRPLYHLETIEIGSLAPRVTSTHKATSHPISVDLTVANLMNHVKPEHQVNISDVSKVVDGAGKPLVVYHGTQHDFSRFDNRHIESEAGFFFTDNPKNAGEYADGVGGRLIPAYLNIKKPYEYTAKEWADGDGLDLDKLAASGYDGAVIRGQDGADTWIALKPEQIKSATGNRGTFDETNHDLRYNVSGLVSAGAIAPINADTISKAFPGATVKQNGNSYTVTLRNGRTITINSNAEITLNRSAASRAYGRKLSDDAKAVGSFKAIGLEGLIALSKDANGQILDHEVYHSARAMALTDQEIAAMQKKYANEEEEALAYERWKANQNAPERKSFVSKLFAKISRFFARVRDAFILDDKAVFRAIRDGRVWDRNSTEKSREWSTSGRLQLPPEANQTHDSLSKDNISQTPNDIKAETDSSDVHYRVLNATQKLAEKLGMKAAANVEVARKKGGLNPLRALLNTPLRLAKHSAAVKAIVREALTATTKNEELRNDFSHRIEKVAGLLKSDADKESFNEIMWRGEVAQEEYSNEQLRSEGVKENVIRAYRQARAIFKRAYTLANEVSQGIQL